MIKIETVFNFISMNKKNAGFVVQIMSSNGVIKMANNVIIAKIVRLLIHGKTYLLSTTIDLFGLRNGLLDARPYAG
jgi:hypothetical protein